MYEFFFLHISFHSICSILLLFCFRYMNEFLYFSIIMIQINNATPFWHTKTHTRLMNKRFFLLLSRYCFFTKNCVTVVIYDRSLKEILWFNRRFLKVIYEVWGSCKIWRYSSRIEVFESSQSSQFYPKCWWYSLVSNLGTR